MSQHIWLAANSHRWRTRSVIRLQLCVQADIGSSRPIRARSSAVEHYLDMVGVTGSIPVAPTILRHYPRPLSSIAQALIPAISGAGAGGPRKNRAASVRRRILGEARAAEPAESPVGLPGSGKSRPPRGPGCPGRPTAAGTPSRRFRCRQSQPRACRGDVCGGLSTAALRAVMVTPAPSAPVPAPIASRRSQC